MDMGFCSRWGGKGKIEKGKGASMMELGEPRKARKNTEEHGRICCCEYDGTSFVRKEAQKSQKGRLGRWRSCQELGEKSQGTSMMGWELEVLIDGCGWVKLAVEPWACHFLLGHWDPGRQTLSTSLAWA